MAFKQFCQHSPPMSLGVDSSIQATVVDKLVVTSEADDTEREHKQGRGIVKRRENCKQAPHPVQTNMGLNPKTMRSRPEAQPIKPPRILLASMTSFMWLIGKIPSVPEGRHTPGALTLSCMEYLFKTKRRIF
ncbi:uncharacterized protein LOC144244769 [Crocuta crocuta]